MYLTISPPLSCKVLLSGAAAATRWDDGLGQVLYCDSGRTALAIALRLLRPGPPANIVVPGLNCEAVIDTVVNSGVRIRYYDVPETLEPAIEAVEAAVDDRTACVCVIHYFGLAVDLAPIRRFCDARGIPLIEDCAQALFSAGEASRCGTVGDLAVFSLRKTLPVPNGGAIAVNRPAYHTALRDIILKKPSPAGTIARTVFLLMKYHLMDHGQALQAAKRLYLGRVASGGTASEAPQWEALSSLSERILGAADAPAITAARQERFRYWAKVLRNQRGVRMIRPILTPATCPYSFPVLIDSREEVLGELMRAGVYLEATFSGAPFLKPLCTPAWYGQSSAGRLGKHLVSLPVHQALTMARMDEIAGRFISALEHRQ
ncbi:MAG TPA: DegT/DnrJ/EryC1/StrS family aminotransferase [Candidatus Acidoferrales bacterium]|nr:DegT/DnrJ/EryC1/StrS family aminotransferase [Candidatus Acidoferrales bacterium]